MNTKTKQLEQILKDNPNKVLHTGSNRFYGEGNDIDYVIHPDLHDKISQEYHKVEKETTDRDDIFDQVWNLAETHEKDYFAPGDTELDTTFRINNYNLILVTELGWEQWNYATRKFLEMIRSHDLFEMTKQSKEVRVGIFKYLRASYVKPPKSLLDRILSSFK